MSVVSFEPLLQNRAVAVAPEACYYFSIILFITPEKLSTLENHYYSNQLRVCTLMYVFLLYLIELFSDRGTVKAVFWKVYCKMFTFRINRIMIQLLLFVLIQLHCLIFSLLGNT